MITNANKINELVTDLCNKQGYHRLTKLQRQFLEDAIRIHLEKHVTFCCLDFPRMSRANFRQMLYRLRDLIELDCRSNPCFYKIKGFVLFSGRPNVTDRPTGDSMFTILRKLREQPPKIHDIKLKFNANLYCFFHKYGAKENPHNHCIIQRIFIVHDVTFKLLIYPSTVQLDISCTAKPFVYDISSVERLSFLLGRLYQQLLIMTRGEAEMPPFETWIVTHYHFGMDGTETYSGQAFHRTYEDVAIGLIRFYTKEMNDDRLIPRLECVQTPRVSLEKEFDKMIAQEMMQG